MILSFGRLDHALIYAGLSSIIRARYFYNFPGSLCLHPLIEGVKSKHYTYGAHGDALKEIT